MGRITDEASARLIGAHTVDNGGIHMAARRAGPPGMRALQIFTAIPKYYGDKSSIRPERVHAIPGDPDAGRASSRSTWWSTRPTCSTPRPPTRRSGARASAGLRKELERSTALGVGAVCFHPGAATGGDRAAAVARVPARSPPRSRP